FLDTSSVTLTFETRSADFAPLAATPPDNPFQWEASAGWSRNFTSRFYGGLEASYSKVRGEEPDRSLYRVNTGFQLSRKVSLQINGAYETAPDYRGFSFFLTLTARLGARGTARAEYDSRYQQGRIAYSTYKGQDVGSWNLAVDANHGPGGGAVNGVFAYIANRA